MAERRLNAQTPEAVLTGKADYLLCNDADLETLTARAEALYQTLCTRPMGGAARKGGV